MDKSKLIANVLGDKLEEDFSLKDFSFERRYAYISMVASLAWSDGSIDDRERVILEEIAKEVGDDISQVLMTVIEETKDFNIENFNKWVGKITGMKMKVSLMADLLLTAFADSIYMQSENFYMKYVSGKLGVNYTLYEKIFRKVQLYMDQVKKEKEKEELEQAEAENKSEKNNGIIQRFVNSIVR